MDFPGSESHLQRERAFAFVLREMREKRDALLDLGALDLLLLGVFGEALMVIELKRSGLLVGFTAAFGAAGASGLGHLDVIMARRSREAEASCENGRRQRIIKE